MAEGGRLRPAVACGNDHGSLQGADRTASSSPRLRCPADRGGHRHGGPELDACGWTPKICPRSAGHRIAVQGWGHLDIYPPSAPTPCRCPKRGQAAFAGCATIIGQRCRSERLHPASGQAHGDNQFLRPLIAGCAQLPMSAGIERCAASVVLGAAAIRPTVVSESPAGGMVKRVVPALYSAAVVGREEIPL